MRASLLGFRHSKGEFNGNPYDYITVYTYTRMETRDNQKGRAGIEIRADLSLKQRLSDYDYNLEGQQVELVIEKVAIGKGQSTDLIVDFKVLPPVKYVDNK